MKRKRTKRSASTRKDPNRYPKGWSARSIKALAEHYDNQSEDDAVAEDEAAYRSTLVTMMAVPVELVPQVHKLIAKRARMNNAATETINNPITDKGTTANL